MYRPGSFKVESNSISRGLVFLHDTLDEPEVPEPEVISDAGVTGYSYKILGWFAV